MVRQIAHKRYGGKKHKILYRDRDYHGSTIAAMSAGGQPSATRNTAPSRRASSKCRIASNTAPVGSATARNTANGRRRDRGGDPARGSRHGRRALPRAGHRRRRRHHPAARATGSACRRSAAKYDILLHIDEVVCGVGRTGTWFGYQHYGIKPDFVTMAKGVASGYAAIACMVTTEKVFEMFKDDPRTR
jgi:taurine-pyruvate aminotransferase